MARGNGRFEDDFSARYVEAATQPAPLVQSVQNQVLGSVFGSGPSRQDMIKRVNSGLLKEIAKGDTSIVGYVSGYDNKVAKMQDLLQSDLRNYEVARTIFRDLQETASANIDSLDSVIAVSDVGGSVAENLARSAMSLKSGAYQNAQVVIGGRAYTLGQLFKAGDANPLEDFGVSPEAADAYLGTDKGLSSAVGVFVKPAVSLGGAGDPRRPSNAGLLNKASAFVAGGRDSMDESGNYVEKSNYTRMKDAFGEANVVPVLTSIRDKFEDIGGMNLAMESVLSYAESRRETTGGQDTGDAAKHFLSFVDKVAQDVFFDPSKNKVPETLSPSERRWALEAAVAALGATTESGVEFDFGDRRVRSAIEKAAKAVNLARSSGYNLHEEVKAVGGDIAEEFKSHIRAFLDNDGYQPSTFVSREAEARDVLQSRILIAPVEGTVPQVSTGAAGAYDDPSRATGRVYASSAVGALEKRIEGAVMKELAPSIHGGKGLDVAVMSALSDTSVGGGRERLLGAVAKEFGKAIPGFGGKVLTRSVLLPMFEETLTASNTQPFEMYRILEDIATKEGESRYLQGLSTDEASAAIGAAARWYKANVSRDKQMQSIRKELIDHLMDGRYNVPLRADEAALRADTIIQQGLELLGNTDDQRTFYSYVREFTNRGVMFVPAPAVVKKGIKEQVPWDRREPGTGRPVFTLADVDAYDVLPDQYEQVVLPSGEPAGPRIFAIPLHDVDERRRMPNPAWETDNESNRMVYEAQRKYFADPSKYIIKE